VTGQSDGTATLTAASEGKSATLSITVVSFIAMQPGPRNTCAIATGGRVYCAGADYGNLAKPEGGELRFASLASHGEPPNSDRTHTCGITIDGDSYCWGANTSGELGTGDTQASAAPRIVAGHLRFKQLTAGRYHTCGLTPTGAAFCWGAGSRGQLGNGGLAGSSVPVAVSGLTQFSVIAAGKDHTCGLTSSGSALCWGSNNLAELGTGTADDVSPTPTPVAGRFHFVELTTKLATSCALDDSGTAYCWGDDTLLQLGASASSRCDGEKPCAREPVAVNTALRFATIAASQFAMCATTSELQTYCWGGNMQEMFGSASPPSTCGTSGFQYGCTLQPTPGPSGFERVVGGHRNYCGIRDDGIAYCWGGNDAGQLGFPGIAVSNLPRRFGIDPTS
jgi:alpha-tubulin suppressor-like RCC1 family protein